MKRCQQGLHRSRLLQKPNRNLRHDDESAFRSDNGSNQVHADNLACGVAKPDEFKTPSMLFTITDLGGWTDVAKKFFDPDEGIMAKVEKGIGVSTSK